MIVLGSRYGEVLAKLPTEASETLLKHLRETFDIEADEPVEELLDASTDEGVFSSGGIFLKVEDEDDLLDMMGQCGCADIRDTPQDDDIGFDVAMYLDKAEKLAMLVLCTSDEGGDAYIVCEELMDEFPSIREHIFKANEE